MSSSTNNMIKIVGPVVLDIQGNLHIQTSPYCRITIAETGSLELHVSGRLRLDSTGGGIDNQTLDPKKCVILSTSTSGAQNVSFAYSNSTTPATPAFYGCIYMPNEDLTVDTGVIVYGAISARNVTFSSEATVHYDTSLRYVNINGVDQPYAIAQWRELTDPNERAVLP